MIPSILMSRDEKKEFSLLATITSILASSLNKEDTLKEMVEVLKDKLNISYVLLRLIDPGTTQFFNELILGLSDTPSHSDARKYIETVAETVCTTNQPTIIQNILEDANCVKNLSPLLSKKPKSLLCLPIWVGSEKIGALATLTPFETSAQFQSLLNTLKLITLLIGQELMLIKLKTNEQMELLQENIKLKDELKSKYNIHNMVGQSNEMKRVYESITQVANTNATVLIRGESGTGKELVANAIHYNSNRSGKSFMGINCGAIPEGLMESELFGYEKGAFTDASQKKIGKFEASEGGTLFLDEISELPPALQVKLLRVLQEKEFTPVGSVISIKSNVRIIAATNKNLEKEVELGRFREDLYYRLNVFPIFLPPLRERKSDMLLLANHFIEKLSKEMNKNITRISSMAIDWLSKYHWPGNVRELENAIERAMVVCNSDVILAEHLPPTLQYKKKVDESKEQLSLSEMTQTFERNLIIEILKKHNGNQSKTAKALATTNRILGYKIKNLNIDTRLLSEE